MMNRKTFFAYKLLPIVIIIAAGMLGLVATTQTVSADSPCVAGPHKGTISSDQTWCLADSPHIVEGDVVVSEDVTLTIEPGVKVEFVGYLGVPCNGCDLIVNGSLQASGSDAQNIRFTSGRNVPEKGDWGRIYFGDYSTNNVLDYVLMEYGGYFGDPIVYTSTDDLLIDHSTIRRSDGTALQIYNAAPTVRNTTFDGNDGSAIFLTGGSSFPDLNNLTASGNGHDAITINGAVYNQDYTWGGTGISTYRIVYEINNPGVEDVTVDPGITLTIEPGTTIKFGGTRDLIVNGTLDARGTDTQTIRFTSHSVTPAKGDWGLVYFTEDSVNNNLDYVLLEYGGGTFIGEPKTNVYIQSDDVVINHSTIQRSSGHGLEINNAAPTVRNTTFNDNDGSAIFLTGGSSFPDLSNLNASGNGHDAITIDGNSYTVDYTWGDSGIPLYRLVDDVTVNQGVTLTIEPNTIVKLNKVDMVVQGTLKAQGIVSGNIMFTSDSTTPDKGDWGKIHFEKTSANNVLDYVTIEYGGGLFTGASLVIDTSSLTIRHSTITRSGHDGIKLNGGAPVIEYNSIIENDGYGLNNIDDAVTAKAMCNWWGHASGPYHPTLNPGGQGQEVSDNVVFTPWLDAPDGGCSITQNMVYLPLLIRK